MSLNKVLNRPIFRREALKKGVLKPIRAQVGTMVGMPVGGSTSYNPNRVPMVVKQPGFFRGMVPYAQRIGRGIKTYGGPLVSLPGMLGFDAALSAQEKMGIENPYVKYPTALGAAYGATKLPGAATVMGMGAGPQALGLGTLYALYGLGKAGAAEKRRIAAMSPKEYERFKQEQSATMAEGEMPYSAGDMPFVTKPPMPDIKIKKKDTLEDRKVNRGQRPGFEARQVSVVDNLTLPDNETGGKIDLDKVVKNDMKRGQGGGADPIPTTPPPANEDSRMSNKVGDQKDTTGKTTPTGNLSITNAGSVNGKKYSSQIIEKAKQYQRELNEGRRSQAGLMFLANLASGLLSGKTMQGGVAGAMDVLGQALGPAANNYAIMKLKENEVENSLMGQALEIALAEYKMANENVQTKGNLGRVQFIGPGGKVKNFDGGVNENGIPYVLVQGRQIPAADLTSEKLIQLYGPQMEGFKYAQATIKDKISDDEAKAHRLLLQNVKSKNIVYDVKQIISATGAAGTKGNLNIFMSKLNSTLADFGLGSTKEAMAKLNPQKEEFMRSLQLGYDSGEITETQYKKLKKAFGDSDKLMKVIEKNARENLKISENGQLREPTTAELFELVNAQTTLAYALANSFKDTDRLTQKDVTAAEAVINILPAFGGAETAMASLLALEKDLNRSIDNTVSRLERTYFTNEMVINGFLGLLKGSELFGQGTTPGISEQQRNEILGGIQF